MDEGVRIDDNHVGPLVGFVGCKNPKRIMPYA